MADPVTTYSHVLVVYVAEAVWREDYKQLTDRPGLAHAKLLQVESLIKPSGDRRCCRLLMLCGFLGDSAHQSNPLAIGVPLTSNSALMR